MIRVNYQRKRLDSVGKRVKKEYNGIWHSEAGLFIMCIATIVTSKVPLDSKSMAKLWLGPRQH